MPGTGSLEHPVDAAHRLPAVILASLSKRICCLLNRKATDH